MKSYIYFKFYFINGSLIINIVNLNNSLFSNFGIWLPQLFTFNYNIKLNITPSFEFKPLNINISYIRNVNEELSQSYFMLEKINIVEPFDKMLQILIHYLVHFPTSFITFTYVYICSYIK